MRCLDRKFRVKFDPKLQILGKNREIGKNQYNHVFVIKIHVLAKFHEEMMICYKIRGHLRFYHFTELRPEILKILFEKELD